MERSIGPVTALNPYPGYATVATAIAQEALATSKGAVGLVLEHALLTEAQLDQVPSPRPGTP